MASTTEELEAQILAEMESNPEAYAAEESNVLVIDNDLRTIAIPEGIKNLGVESDDDVHRLYFQMPKTYGEFDLSTFDIRINYKNGNIGDVYAVEDKKAEGDVITFSWLVGRNAVKTKGTTQFIVCLKKSDASGVVQQEFNTTVASLNVLEGLETAEQVIQANADIIEQILKKIDGLTSISQEDIANAVADWMTEHPPSGMTAEEKAQLNKNTEDISSLSEEMANLKEIGTGSGKTTLDTFIDNIDVDYAYDADTGANYTIIRIYKNKIDGTKQYPFVYAPNGAGKGTQSTYNMNHDKGFVFAINSGVFDTSTKKPDGIIIQNGAVVQNTPAVLHSGSKPLTISSDGTLGYADADADANELVSNGIVSAVCGFMPIIIDYEAVPDTEWNSIAHYTQNAQRQIIGQFGNDDYAIITCEGRDYDNSDGWTIAEAQSICQKHGLKFAYNLDGGGSTETMLGLKHINTIYEGTTGRVVPTFIVFNGSDNLDEEIVVHTITNNLTNVSTSNNSSGIIDEYSYSATLTADTGYILSNVTVVMDGVDITANAYSTGIVTIEKVTGNVVITAVAVEESSTTIYTISNNLTNVTNSSSVSSVVENNEYTAILSPESGYVLSDVIITMGGVDITSNVYSNGVINIPEVTGNVIITAAAEESSLVAVENIIWVKGFYPHSSGTFRTAANALSALMTKGVIPFGTKNDVTYYLIPIPNYATEVSISIPDDVAIRSMQNDFWYIGESAPSYAGIDQRFTGTEATFESNTYQYLSVVMLLSSDIDAVDTTQLAVSFK